MRSSTRATSLGWLRARNESGTQLWIELDERAGGDHLGAEAVVFLLRAVAPVDLVRLHQRRHLLDPGDEIFVLDGSGGFGRRCGGHGNLLRSENEGAPVDRGAAIHSATFWTAVKGAEDAAKLRYIGDLTAGYNWTKWVAVTRRLRPFCAAIPTQIWGFEICVAYFKGSDSRRIRGSHHIFSRDGIDEILNIQPKHGKAKPYQVKQVRGLILKYRLAGDDE